MFTLFPRNAIAPPLYPRTTVIRDVKVSTFDIHDYAVLLINLQSLLTARQQTVGQISQSPKKRSCFRLPDQFSSSYRVKL